METLEQRLDRDILAVIARGMDALLDDAAFNGLALRVFGYQYEGNVPYRKYCARRGATPDTVTHSRQIPAVPTAVFKDVKLVAGEPVHYFTTSGTTQGGKQGAHYLTTIALYDAAIVPPFARYMLPEGGRMPMLALAPPPHELPHSSLSHMMDVVLRAFGAPGSGYGMSTAGIDVAGVARALRVAEERGEPLFLLGTAFAFVHLLDAMDGVGARVTLPPGSRIMDTGGFKGKSREIGRDELYATYTDRLGVPWSHIVNEYGMTELGSQFYDAVLWDTTRGQPGGRVKHGPPWVRTVVVDPGTLEPLTGEGAVGLLRHYDLVNRGSVMAIQTDDLGRRSGDGFEVLGRATGAEARGCSIAADELLRAVRP